MSMKTMPQVEKFPKHGANGSRPTRHALIAAGFAILVFAAFIVSIPTRVFAIQCLGFALYALLLFLILRKTEAGEVLHGLRLQAKMWTATIIICYSLFFRWYLGQYYFVPTWDSINYWSQTIRFNQNLNQSVHATLINMLKSVNEADYNDLLSWVMSAPVAIFPEWTQTFYAEAILISIPTAMVVAAFITAKIKTSGVHVDANWIFPTLFIITVSPWAFLRPVFTGYLDGPSALLYVAVLAAFFDDNFPIYRSMQIFSGIGLTGTFLLRRWYIYGALGLVVSAAIYWGALMVARKCPAPNRKTLSAILLTGTCALAAVAVFPGFIRHSLTGGQTIAYKSWTYTLSYLIKFTDICSMIGWGWFALAFVAIVTQIYIGIRWRSISKQFWLFESAMVICAFVALILFWQVQDLSPQHYYIFIFSTQIALYMPIFSILGSTINSRLSFIASFALIFLSVFGLLHGLVTPEVNPSLVQIHQSGDVSSTTSKQNNEGTILDRVFGRGLAEPARQNNVEAKQSLADYLASTANGGTVYFAAASIDLNSSLPYSICLPQCVSTSFNRAYADVDSRDGFNTSFFDSEYVVTSDPVSLHMASDKEKVVVNLSSLVQDPNGYIGIHYEMVQSFDFGDSTTVYVYKKISNFSRSDVERVQHLFDNLYPDLPTLFHDRFEGYLNKNWPR